MGVVEQVQLFIGLKQKQRVHSYGAVCLVVEQVQLFIGLKLKEEKIT